ALSTQRRRTMALKDIQDNFKPNPSSLEEILSSKSSNDADRKRSETMIKNPKSIIGALGRQTSLSRSKLSHPCRVEKSRDLRTSLYTGALRVPRNNPKNESRKTVANAIPNRALSTIRESTIPPKRELSAKKNIKQSLATRYSTIKDIPKQDISSTRDFSKLSLSTTQHNVRQTLAVTSSVTRNISKQNLPNGKINSKRSLMTPFPALNEVSKKELPISQNDTRQIFAAQQHTAIHD
ncbi:11527_t:CDS:2, partial [Acaulospora morrowiae]